jgi:hypothetical protein
VPTEAPSKREFKVRDVLASTCSIFVPHFFKFSAVSAVVNFPAAPLILAVWTNTAGGTAAMLLQLFIQLLAANMLSVLAQAIVLYGAFQQIRGQPVNLVNSIGVGFRRFSPAIGLAILIFLPVVGLATLVTFLVTVDLEMSAAILGLLLVIPVLWWVSNCFLAVPACVVEGCGTGASLQKSNRLISGNRWRVFGLVLLLMMPDVIFDTAIAGAIENGAFYAVASTAWTGIWSALYGIAALAAYHDLCLTKDGVDLGQVAAVFE